MARADVEDSDGAGRGTDECQGEGRRVGGDGGGKIKASRDGGREGGRERRARTNIYKERINKLIGTREEWGP